MAMLMQNWAPPCSCQCPHNTPSFALYSTSYHQNVRKKLRGFRVMAQQQQTVEQGATYAFAKDMERLSAKESLLLALKDAGGFEGLVTGKTTDVQRIDVNERIISLERLNPTPRPTTSPFLEGRWNFEWFGGGSPPLVATKFVFGIIPPALANLSKLDLLIRNGYGTGIAHMNLLNSIKYKFVISSKLSVEGPLRMKEEYIEAVIESPKVNEESVPEQLRGAFGQASSTLQQLPVPVRDIMSNGLKIPLGESYKRLIMISYLDEEILIARDGAGEPEILTRLDSAPDSEPVISEYES